MAVHLPHRTGRVSWRALAQTAGPVLVLSAVVLGVAVWLALVVIQSPPRTLTIATGAKGSSFETDAQRYRPFLKREGITLKVLPTAGSLDNLNRLADPHSGVDIALVQAGITSTRDTSDLVSLGTLFYQPLLFFYRSAKPLQRLSELRGKRIAIGPTGSGTRYIAIELLGANGVDATNTQISDLEGEAARKALLGGQVDAIFLTGDSAPPETIRAMLHTEGIRLYNFARADAYVRRFPFLSKLVVPAGTFDLGADLPPTDLTLLAPTVELIARSTLHPALSDLLLETAFKVQGRATLLQTAGEFPRAVAHDFPLSTEAARYYKSGSRSLVYRILPFWMASLVSRITVVVVPLLVILIPGLRYLPQLYSWRVEARIHHRYGELMALERQSLTGEISEERQASLLDRLRQIEKSIIEDKIPSSHAEQLYLLRHHMRLVREHLSPLAAERHRESLLPLQRTSG